MGRDARHLQGTGCQQGTQGLDRTSTRGSAEWEARSASAHRSQPLWRLPEVPTALQTGEAQEAGVEAGRGPVGWGNGLGSAFQDGPHSGHRSWLPSGCSQCSGYSCPQEQHPQCWPSSRTGCGPGQSPAGILLAPSLGKYTLLERIPLRVCVPGARLGGLAMRTPGESLAQQPSHREPEATSGGTQEAVSPRHWFHFVLLALPRPHSLGSDPSPRLSLVVALAMFFISDCSVACIFPFTQASVRGPFGHPCCCGSQGWVCRPSLCGEAGSPDTRPHTPCRGS